MSNTEERYLVASSTSNLRVIADSVGDGDVMIAAGWSSSRIGSALMRLHTRATRENLALVHEQVTIQARKFHLTNPDAVAGSVIAWWLDKVCTTCHGRKFDAISGTPSLSTIECPKCHGTGERHLPHGDAGKKIASWMDYCKACSIDLIKIRLRPDRQ